MKAACAGLLAIWGLACMGSPVGQTPSEGPETPWFLRVMNPMAADASAEGTQVTEGNAASQASADPVNQPSQTPDSTALSPTGEPVVEDSEDETEELTPEQVAGTVQELATLEADTGLTLQAKLDAVFTRYKTLGAVVCVVENGAVSHTYAYGELSPGGEPMRADTLFRVGSISKMVTAMGVMRLVDDGLVTLDGDLSEALGVTVRNPRYPDTPITLRQLMSHTAGFRDSGYYTLALRGQVTPLTKLFSGNAAAFQFIAGVAPGTESKYSNFGGGLLGSLIESVTGETVDEYMNRVIFAPLGIRAAYQSSLLPADAVVSDMFKMPARTLSATVRDTATENWDPESAYTLTAGKLTLSAPDLAKLVIALCDGGVQGDVRVLSESAALLMRTPQNHTGSVECDSKRGLCMNILDGTVLEGRTLYGHGGKANGMLCAAYFDPEDRTGVVMLTNGCNNRPMYQDVGMLSIAVLRLCYQELIDGRHVTADPWLVAEEPEATSAP